MEISAKTKDQTAEQAVTVSYEFGANLSDAVQLFGEDVIFNKAIDSLVIDVQAHIRRLIKKGSNPTEIAAVLAGWKPGVSTTVRRSAGEKVQDLITRMTPEERIALLKEL